MHSKSKFLITIVFFLLCNATSYGQKWPLPLDETTNKIVWKGEVKVDSVAKDEMVNKIARWALQNNYRIEQGNEKFGIIILDGSVEFTKGTDSDGKKYNAPHRIYIYVEKNSYSFEIKDVSITRRPLEYFYTRDEYTRSLNTTYENIDDQMLLLVERLKRIFN